MLRRATPPRLNRWLPMLRRATPRTLARAAWLPIVEEGDTAEAEPVVADLEEGDTAEAEPVVADVEEGDTAEAEPPAADLEEGDREVSRWLPISRRATQRLAAHRMTTQ